MKRKILFSALAGIILTLTLNPSVAQAVGDWVASGNDIKYEGGIVSAENGAIFSSKNPNNVNASVSLSWLNNIPRLRVGGSGSGAASAFQIQGVGNVVRMHVGNNVGIGTTNPIAKFHSKTTGSIGGTYNVNAAAIVAEDANGKIGLDGNQISATGTMFLEGKNEIRLRTGATPTERIRISGNGNVGIGTTTPGAKLDVKGQLRADDYGTAGQKNLTIGNDTYFTDLDKANTVGLRGNQNASEATMEFGTAGAKIKVYSDGQMCIGSGC